MERHGDKEITKLDGIITPRYEHVKGSKEKCNI